ncbi:fumarate reductase subunit FrdD [Microlunatus sp. Gsoil 973]|uniref:fumarate reductase subunit FrdD n=1 Tax=Microlunatus sp. Gsoil 973 TaxID=2672569 RepID=UPI001E383A85|nr:fumarate reductase subunit FrdD [Microlunatus sp. Gsoil 973]
MDPRSPRRRRPPAEPFVWLGFSAGGMIAALLLPVAAFLFAIAVPLGWLSPDFDHLSAVITHPVTIILMIIGFVVLIIHSAHRLRYLLYDGLKIKHRTLVGALCYGGAVVASIIAVILVLLAAF